MSKFRISRITICGFGLIGGSMALDFLKGRVSFTLTAHDRPAVLKRLKKDKRFKVKIESSFRQAVAGADIVVLAATHTANKSMLIRLSKMRDLTNCLIVDTGAVKQPFAKLAHTLQFAENTQCLPTHPMAGREKAGFENSNNRLFEEHSWFIDETFRTNQHNQRKLRWLISKLRAVPTYLSSKLHDELMSEVSHLPQLISTILGGQVNPEMIPLAGPGLRSMLRLAGSPYSVWSEIIDQNRTEIVKALQNHRDNLGEVVRMIKTKESLDGIFKAAARSYKCL